MSTHVPARFPRKESWSIEDVPFEEKVALLLLTAADGNRGLIDEAIQAVADKGGASPMLASRKPAGAFCVPAFHQRRPARPGGSSRAGSRSLPPPNANRVWNEGPLAPSGGPIAVPGWSPAARADGRPHVRSRAPTPRDRALITVGYSEAQENRRGSGRRKPRDLRRASGAEVIHRRGTCAVRRATAGHELQPHDRGLTSAKNEYPPIAYSREIGALLVMRRRTVTVLPPRAPLSQHGGSGTT
jgi:hypothetical protein